MSDVIPDVFFVFEGIAWLRWVVAGFFFLLGFFMGWWKWRHRRVEKEAPKKASKLSFTADKKEGETAKVETAASTEFGLIYETKPDEVDDLQQIDGIGKALRAKLYSMGIYKFEQIANWTESEVAAVSKALHLTNQIETNKWQDQARSRAGKKS